MEIELRDDSALVLFDRLEEWQDAGPMNVDAPTYWALNELLGSLRERLVEPLQVEYSEKVYAAAGRLCEHYGEPEPSDLRDVVRHAIEEFLAQDAELLEIRCNERTITHRLAIYIERRLRGWTVDCEYNRKGDEIKRLVTWNDLLEAKGLEPASDAERQYVNPDIIVHHRRSGENLLVVEVKPPWGEGGRDRDLLKLEAMRRDLGYEHAVYVGFGSSDASDVDVVWL